jgi:uncharacterized caspase-like protein
MNTAQIYAVTIGIRYYKHLSELSCATNDAQDIAEVLRNGSQTARVKLLLDADATKHCIMQELKWLANSIGSGDTAIIFFSGYVRRKSQRSDEHAYLCPVETSLLDVQTCMTSGELITALRAIRSERLVVLLDTCYSSGTGKLGNHNASDSDGLTSRDVSAFIEGSGRMIMAASRPSELAWKLSGRQNSPFTNYLLRGLGGEIARADGTIWASEIFSYVSRHMRQRQCHHLYQRAIGEDFVVMVRHSAKTP